MQSWTQFYDPVPTPAFNNVIWDSSTDASKHVMTEKNGKCSTAGVNEVG